MRKACVQFVGLIRRIFGVLSDGTSNHVVMFAMGDHFDVFELATAKDVIRVTMTDRQVVNAAVAIRRDRRLCHVRGRAA